MFDVGFWELVILFGLGLMVLGPERMPKVAAQLGRWAGQARNMARHLTTQFSDELEPFKKSMDAVNEGMSKAADTDWSAKRPEPGISTATTDADADAETNTQEAATAAAAPSETATPKPAAPVADTPAEAADSGTDKNA